MTAMTAKDPQQRNKATVVAFYELDVQQGARSIHEPGFMLLAQDCNDEDGRIVEHWDVLQVVPPTSANPNTMF